jgi:hypothetical protein
MILVDTNLLLYAKVREFPQHNAARAWLDERLNDITGVGLPWQSLLAFVRLASNPRIFQRPLPTSEAWGQVEEWLSCRNVWVPEPTERHGGVLRSLLGSVGNRSNLIPDAHLAALAMEYGLILCSSDADFSRFEGLRWRNPLSA